MKDIDWLVKWAFNVRIKVVLLTKIGAKNIDNTMDNSIENVDSLAVDRINYFIT